MKKLLMKILLHLKLPFWILYGLADIAYVVIYYVVGYRKKVVKENLRNSFPEKTEDSAKILPPIRRLLRGDRQDIYDE